MLKAIVAAWMNQHQVASWKLLVLQLLHLDHHQMILPILPRPLSQQSHQRRKQPCLPGSQLFGSSATIPPYHMPLGSLFYFRYGSVLLFTICFRNEISVKIPAKIPVDFPTIPPKLMAFVVEKKIFEADFDSLLPGNWLTDNVIDVFLELMKVKAEQRGAVVSVVPSFLFPTIAMGLPFDGWIQPEQFDVWLMPCQVHRDHWILLVAFMRKKIFLVLDSLSKTMSSEALDRVRVSVFSWEYVAIFDHVIACLLNFGQSYRFHAILSYECSCCFKECLDNFFCWFAYGVSGFYSNHDKSKSLLQIACYLLSMRHQALCGYPIEWSKWSFYCPIDVIVQKNCFDCGMFVCMWAAAVCTQCTLLKRKPDLASLCGLRKWTASVLHDNISDPKER